MALNWFAYGLCPLLFVLYVRWVGGYLTQIYTYYVETMFGIDRGTARGVCLLFFFFE